MLNNPKIEYAVYMLQGPIGLLSSVLIINTLMNRDIGKSAERELVSILREEGFNAVRVPTSNSSPNPLPDIFATKGNILLGIECKSTWENKVRVKESQIRKLFEFLSMFTMDRIPIVAVKFKKIHRWKVYLPNRIEEIIVTLDNSIFLEELLSEIKSFNAYYGSEIVKSL